jgi:DNA-binding transcriptional ArsR family regulator
VEVIVTTTGTKRRATAQRDIEDAVSYALGHGTRIQILALLNEGPKTQAELVRVLGLSQPTIHHHLVELVKSGSIEELDGRRVGNIVERRYRALKTGEFSVDDYREMSEVEGKVTIGITLQNAIAEHLAAYRADEIRGDNPNVVMNWAWLNLDEEGQAELTAELAGSWVRMKAIEARAAGRCSSSTPDGRRSVIVSSIAHPRVRPVQQDPSFSPLVKTE